MNVHKKLARFLHPLCYSFIKLLAVLTNKKPRPNLRLPNDARHDARTSQQNGLHYSGSSCNDSRYLTFGIHNERQRQTDRERKRERENQDLSYKMLATKASLTLRSTVQLTDM
jgi:hypothetical protein